MLLDHIKQSSDIKKLKEDQYPELAREIRQFLIEKICQVCLLTESLSSHL